MSGGRIRAGGDVCCSIGTWGEVSIGAGWDVGIWTGGDDRIGAGGSIMTWWEQRAHGRTCDRRGGGARNRAADRCHSLHSRLLSTSKKKKKKIEMT